MEPAYITIMISGFYALALMLALGNLFYAYRKHRIAWGYRFGKPQWAERSRLPVVFWSMVALYVLLAGRFAYLLVAGES
ncbi:hypothetical protein OF829_09420 [Sphingomonas sp. LB-2]|uniref:hypothetical protein n=1 Tax=Sphingomonas caeni TaxID=2984949 RepID=UPI00222F1D4B|nr:hypothetical protein [Sphingomonas caeni]MCW3847461.1 hypothetical protein [Sphingomonas caeni]